MKQMIFVLSSAEEVKKLQDLITAKSKNTDATSQMLEAFARQRLDDHGYTAEPNDAVKAIMDTITDDQDAVMLMVDENGALTSQIVDSGDYSLRDVSEESDIDYFEASFEGLFKTDDTSTEQKDTEGSQGEEHTEDQEG